MHLATNVLTHITINYIYFLDADANLYPVCERRQAENMIKDRSFPYQYNFRAETLDYACVVEPVDQPGKFHISRTNLADLERIKTAREDPKEGAIQRGRFRRNQEMPTHPNMVDATPWNNGTQFSPKEKERTLTRMTQTARASTAKVSKRLTGSKDYMKPRRQSDKLANDIREMKKSGTFKPDYGNTDKKGSTTNNATPSSTVVNAYKDEFKNRYSIEPSRKYHSTQHSGVWEYSKIDGRHMWSDTGSFVFDSRGDVIKKHNPDAFNLENPTLSKPLRTGLVDVNHVDHR